MPQAVAGRGVTPCQIDGFPEGCKRSREGAIYLRPSSSEEMTDDELEFIKQKYPEVYKELRIVEVQAKRSSQKAEPEAVVEPMPEKAEEPPAESFSFSAKKKGKSQ